MALSIPPHDRWLELTAVTLRSRSSELKAVDAAIKTYQTAPTDANAGRIRSAWAHWKNVKGDGWASNDRNRKGALTKLDQELATLRVALSPQDRDALMFIDQQRRLRYRTTFTGKSIRLRKGSAALEVLKLSNDFHCAIGDGRKVAAAMSDSAAVKKGVADLFGVAGGVETLKGLGQQLAMVSGGSQVVRAIDAVVDCIPGLSLIKGGGAVVFQWGQVVKQHYDKRQMGTHAFALTSGAASAAFNAVIAMMQRDLDFQIATATTSTVAFGAKAAATATGYGAVADPFLGAAKQMAQLVQSIVKFAIEVREMVALQEILRDADRIRLDAFSTCPLFGAYMLVTSDTSDLLSMLVSEFGQADWMSNIEKVVRQDIKPVLSKAGDYVREAPYIIENVPMHRRQNKTGWDKLTGAGKSALSAMVG